MKNDTYDWYDTCNSVAADVDDSSWCSLGFSNPKVMLALMKVCVCVYYIASFSFANLFIGIEDADYD